MTYSVQAGTVLDALPDDSRREILQVLQQVAEAVSTIPADNAFWSSMDDSLLQIDVAGWRVTYAVDPRRREVRMVEVAQRRR